MAAPCPVSPSAVSHIPDTADSVPVRASMVTSRRGTSSDISPHFVFGAARDREETIKLLFVWPDCERNSPCRVKKKLQAAPLTPEYMAPEQLLPKPADPGRTLFNGGAVRVSDGRVRSKALR